MAPHGFSDSLRQWLDLVARCPDRNHIHPRLKPWLCVVKLKTGINTGEVLMDDADILIDAVNEA
jgi:hypothetical protein